MLGLYQRVFSKRKRNKTSKTQKKISNDQNYPKWSAKMIPKIIKNWSLRSECFIPKISLKNISGSLRRRLWFGFQPPTRRQRFHWGPLWSDTFRNLILHQLFKPIENIISSINIEKRTICVCVVQTYCKSYINIQIWFVFISCDSLVQTHCTRRLWGGGPQGGVGTDLRCCLHPPSPKSWQMAHWL